jgi:DNA-binding SARP family transcriptional activator
MCQLRLSLFGVPIVKHGETTLTFSTRKALALLVCLAVEGRLHTRKTLSEAFWPELDAKHGRAALRATLLELRRLCERSHEAGEGAHLRIEGETLGIARDGSLLVDLRLVEAAGMLAERGVAPHGGQAREDLLAQLEEASRLVRGPFLAGFTLRDSQFFDDWSTQHREYWHRRVYQVFDALSLLYEQGGEVERAIDIMTRWLSFDPLNEEGYRRLMRLRFSQGDRVGALRAYSHCHAVLAEELQAEPEPETVALAKRMRHTAPLSAVQARPAQTTPGQPPATLLDGPILGRAAEFGTLIECYQRARVGQPQLVLLVGESGIGKTRLASEFVGWAQAQGADVLAGSALQTGSQLVYQPLMDALRRRLEQEHVPADLGSPAWLAELARLLPELRDLYPDLPAPATDEAFGHNRLFEATTRLVQKWAARRPLVLSLDNMQWADPAMLDLLLYLAHRLTEQPVPLLLLLNLSTEAAPRAGAQSAWLMALKRACLPLTELQLTSFTQEETRRFVQELSWAEQPLAVEHTCSTGGCPGDGQASERREALLSFSDWLYRQTSGQPLYLVEILKWLVARDIIFPSLQDRGSWGLVLRPEMLTQTPASELIPQTLREQLRSYLSRLSPSPWTLLVAAATLEEGLSFERLCQVAGLDELEGLRSLEELLHGGWLTEGTACEEPQALQGFVFTRQVIREVVYQEAGVTRRSLMQRRLATIIREGITAAWRPGKEEEHAIYTIHAAR